jgi:hypothetical protein
MREILKAVAEGYTIHFGKSLCGKQLMVQVSDWKDNQMLSCKTYISKYKITEPYINKTVGDLVVEFKSENN